MSIGANKKVIEHFDALLGVRDLSNLDVLCTPGMINHALAPMRPQGLAGTREFLQTAGAGQFNSHRWDELTVVAEGDFVVQFGQRGGDWPGGKFLGIDAPAGSYSRGFAAMYRLQAGRIAERWAVRDDLGMLRQLGALA